MKKIRTKEAVGQVLCHDMTQIVPGVKKGPAFRRGHVVRKEDIPLLLSMGKDWVYVWENREGMMHEDDAARVLCGICRNEGMRAGPPQEGKITIRAERDGLFKVDAVRLDAVNSVEYVVVAVRGGNTPVRKGEALAGVKVVPLMIPEASMQAARRAAGPEPILSLLPYRRKKVGIVTTGNEVFYGRIKDGFGPILREKLAAFPAELLGQKIVGDDPNAIAAAIRAFLAGGAQMVLCTGGMSVDPDDRTPAAIRASGAEIVTYGAPVLPGAMFLLAYADGNVPVVGLPAGALFDRRTVFDLLLPRMMADEKLTKADIVALGRGGLCLHCEPCRFPACGFGRG